MAAKWPVKVDTAFGQCMHAALLAAAVSHDPDASTLLPHTHCTCSAPGISVNDGDTTDTSTTATVTPPALGGPWTNYKLTVCEVRTAVHKSLVLRVCRAAAGCNRTSKTELVKRVPLHGS